MQACCGAAVGRGMAEPEPKPESASPQEIDRSSVGRHPEHLQDGVRELLRLTDAYRGFSVQNHPTPAFNGSYQRCGTWNDRPAYRRADEEGSESAHCLYYWKSEAADLDDDEPEAKAEAVADEEAEADDFGAGWTFDTRALVLPDPAALTRTQSVAQPAVLSRGAGGLTAEPYLAKMFPPEGEVLMSDGSTVFIEKIAPQLGTGAEEGVPSCQSPAGQATTTRSRCAQEEPHYRVLGAPLYCIEVLRGCTVLSHASSCAG